MPASVRDILLLIKTKEDASRSMAGISASMRKAAAAADAASARARAASLRAQAMHARTTGATVAQVRALQAAARAADAQATSIERADKTAGRFGKTVERVGHLAQTAGLLIAGAGLAGFIGMKSALETAIAWEKQVRLTFTQVDKKYKPSLKELGDIGLRTARDIAVPFEEVQTALFDVFSSTEATMPQAEKLLRSFSMAAVAGNTDIQTASRATIGLMNAYKVPFKDVNKILDIQFQLVQEGVGTYEEWAQRIGLVTPSAVRAGQSIETMAAALATSTRMGVSAARSGTAVARAFDAMSHPKTEANLREIGIATRDAKGNFLPLVDVLTKWKQQLDKMPKADRLKSILAVLKGAGGTIEARRFLQNILLSKGGLELFQDQIKEFATDKGAFEKAYNEMSNTVAAKTQQLHNGWMELKLALGNALLPTFTKLVDHLQRLIDWFNKLPQSTKNTIAQFVLWGSAIAVVGGVLLIIIGTIVSFAAVVAVAGSALLPMLGAMLGIGAIIGVVVAGFVAFGAALVMAWKKSESFRAMLQSIWGVVTATATVIKNFALSVWQSFSTTVLPALKELWHAIEDNVFPAVREFVNWWKANMLPVIAAAGKIISEKLKPAFKDVADIIRSDVIPALQNVKAWWDQNKSAILPVIKSLAMLVAGAFVVAVTLGIYLVRAVIKVVGWLIKLFNWGVKVGEGIRAGAKVALTSMANMKARIIGLFSSAGSWLASAGRNLVMGFVGGIAKSSGSVARAAGNVARLAISTAMNVLGEKSPSKVFKDIGANVVRGFVLGVKGERKKILDTMFALSRDVIRSINAADIKKAAKVKMRDRWNKKLHTTESKLLKLESKRAGLQKKLASATATYNDLLKKRADLNESVRTAISSSTDISTLTEEQMTSGTTIRAALQQRLADAQKFVDNLRALAARGFDKETIAQLASQGVEAAGVLVNTLSKASDTDLAAISQIQKDIRLIAGQAGTSISGDMYNAGIAAAQGLIKGLNSQIANITKTMTAIANALVKAIKKELGIKSPSKVFDDIGVNTAQGYVNGYTKRMNASKSVMAGASLFTPATAPTRLGMNPAYAGGTTYSRVYDQKITVNTNEIDPRKTSAELGWELEGRLA